MIGKGVATQRLRCRYHPDAELLDDYHAGDVVCSACGLVVADRVIDVSSEWRTFNDNGESKDMSRVGRAENPLLDGNDLYTRIQEYATKSGAASETSQVPKFKKSSAAKAMDHSFGFMKNISDRMNVSTDVMENAVHLFKSIQGKLTMKGRNKEAIMASCLYMECRRVGVSRTFSEFCAATGIAKNLIGRSFKSISRLLDAKQQLRQNAPVADVMSRFCAHAGLSADIGKKARELAVKATEMGIVGGRAPSTVASAAIFIAAELGGCKKSFEEISQVTGVAQSTMKQCLKVLLPRLKEIYRKEDK